MQSVARTIEKLPPDRPIASWQKPVRQLVRGLRTLRYRLQLGSKLRCGKNVVLAKGLELYPPEYIHFGNNIYIGPDFAVQTNLVIGDNTLVSGRVSCLGNDHNFDDPQATIIEAGRLPACTIIMEGDNLIGYGSIVVGSVTIGKGCIVGAGSVVTRDLPPYTVCAGVPAKPIRKRYQREPAR
ncbi:MAG: acyltransferase [Terriglobales bacterium]